MYTTLYLYNFSLQNMRLAATRTMANAPLAKTAADALSVSPNPSSSDLATVFVTVTLVGALMPPIWSLGTSIVPFASSSNSMVPVLEVRTKLMLLLPLILMSPSLTTATAIAETVCYTLSGKAIRSTFMDFSMRDANLMQLLVSIVKAYIACMLATETQAAAATTTTVGEVSDESLLTEREILNAGLPQLDQALLAAIRSTHYMTVHDLEKNVDIIRIRSCKQFDKKTAVARGTATRKKKEEKKRKQQQQREEEERKKRKGIVKHKWVKIKTFTGSTSKFGGKWNSKTTGDCGGGGWGTLLKHKS